MKKRLFVLLFVMVMALSVFSVTASAAATISTVGVTNLRSPLAGNTPDYDIDFINSKLVTKQVIAGYDTINGIIWYRLDSPNTGSTLIEKKMNKNDTFELGKKYRVRIFVMPHSGAQFANSVSALIYELGQDVEGMGYKTATVTTPTGNTATDYKVVSYDYVCGKAAIGSVEITGLKLPKAGEYPDNDCNVITEGVYVNNLNGKVEWIHNGSIINPATDKFVAGETYKLSLWLRTEFEDGYYFMTDTQGENIAEVFINGIPFEVCDTYECDYVRGVEYEFYVPFNEIRNVDIVGISTPVAGKEPDFEGAPTTDGYDIVNLFWLDNTLKTELIGGGKTYTDAVAEAKLQKGDGKVFEEGHEYLICIAVKPQDSYEIAYEIDGGLELLSYAATVNGKAANEGSGYRGEDASFDCSFGTPVKQLIFNVDITGIDSPVAGNTPDYTAVCGADSYDIVGISWSDITLRDDLIAKGSTYVEAAKQAQLVKGDGKTFKRGHIYSVNFEVKPNKNYEIDYDPSDYDMLYYNATVNNEDAKESSGYRGENANFSYTFEHTCAFNLIAKVDATCTDKGKKAYYMCSCGKITEDSAGSKIIADIDTWGIIPVNANNHIGGTATCTAKAKCTLCGASYGSLKAHTEVKVSGKAATCTATGLTEGKKCSVCGKVTVAQQTIAKKSHTEVKVKGKAATCTKTGLTGGKKCSVCGKVTVAQKSVAKKAHTYKTTTTKATLKKNGKQVTKCTACGKVSKTVTVYYPKSIKLSATSYTYNGKTKKPTVTVKDSKGKTVSKNYYTVKYASGRKNPGKYTVTVTFKGKYSGTKKLTFTIKPAKVSLSKVTAGSKQLTANWKTANGVTGYELQASTSSKFTSKTTKKVTIKSAKTKKSTIKKLTKGKKYYVKIRAYKTVGKTKIYGAWSSVKTIKVK